MRLSLLFFFISFAQADIIVRDKEGARQLELLQSHENTVRSLIKEIVDESIPELQKDDIVFEIFPINSRSVFFVSQFDLRRLVGIHHYLIGVNPLVFERNCPREAMKGILAHELMHTLHYYNSFDFLKEAWRLLRVINNKELRVRFERKTDLEAIQRGYATQINEYRKWLYQNVPTDKVNEKKEEYFSPLEIRELVKAQEIAPQIFKYWINQIPTKLEKIKKDIRDFLSGDLKIGA